MRGKDFDYITEDGIIRITPAYAGKSMKMGNIALLQ